MSMGRCSGNDKNAKIDNAELLYDLEPDELEGAFNKLCLIYQKAVESGKGVLFIF